MKKDNLYILHIQQAIEKCNSYLHDVSYDAMSHDEILTDALARQLGIIGEAANCLSEEFKEKHTSLPYRDMVAMRNFLVHEYAKVDRKVVWDTCQHDLPSLKNSVEKILASEI